LEKYKYQGVIGEGFNDKQVLHNKRLGVPTCRGLLALYMGVVLPDHDGVHFQYRFSNQSPWSQAGSAPASFTSTTAPSFNDNGIGNAFSATKNTAAVTSSGNEGSKPAPSFPVFANTPFTTGSNQQKEEGAALSFTFSGTPFNLAGNGNKKMSKKRTLDSQQEGPSCKKGRDSDSDE